MADITPQLLLEAYSRGFFPMSDSADDPDIYWVEPERRGIIPLQTFHAPRRLLRTMRKREITYTFNCDFARVMQLCAEEAHNRPNTWINRTIYNLYNELHTLGHAHSLEVYEDGALVGGLYGVALGAAFFGESMFHRARDASKFALVFLVEHLKARGFTLLDTQFITEHLRQFGALEIGQAEYMILLERAVTKQASFV